MVRTAFHCHDCTQAAVNTQLDDEYIEARETFEEKVCYVSGCVHPSGRSGQEHRPLLRIR